MTSFELDDEITRFIEKSDQLFEDSPQSHGFEISDIRENYDRMCRAFHYPYPQGVTAEDTVIGNTEDSEQSTSGDKSVDDFPIPVRHYHLVKRQYLRQETAILYFHGGGFILGGLESHDSVCAEICANTQLPVIAVDYRLAPEYLHPAAFMDALRAYEVYQKKYTSLIVMGDSAGANLAAAVCAATRTRQTKPSGQILIYPALGGEELGLPSYTERAHAPMLSTEDVAYYRAMRSPGPPPSMDPTFNPLMADGFDGLPPCYAFSADIDPLRDDAKEYVNILSRHGISAKYTNEPGLIHGYLRARHVSEKAKNSFMAMCEAARDLGSLMPSPSLTPSSTPSP